MVPVCSFGLQPANEKVALSGYRLWASWAERATLRAAIDTRSPPPWFESRHLSSVTRRSDVLPSARMHTTYWPLGSKFADQSTVY
jgi:hypothetical protein